MITFKCGLPSRHVGSHLAMGVEGGNSWTLLGIRQNHGPRLKLAD